MLIDRLVDRNPILMVAIFLISFVSLTALYISGLGLLDYFQISDTKKMICKSGYAKNVIYSKGTYRSVIIESLDGLEQFGSVFVSPEINNWQRRSVFVCYQSRYYFFEKKKEIFFIGNIPWSEDDRALIEEKIDRYFDRDVSLFFYAFFAFLSCLFVFVLLAVKRD